MNCTHRPSRRRAGAGIIGLLAFLGCGGGDHSSLAPTDFDVSGSWRWEEALSDLSVGVVCADTGTVTVTQDGPRFTGTGVQLGVCEIGGTGYPFVEPFDITAGTIQGIDVGFAIAPCSYKGTLIGSGPDSATGTIRCRQTIQGVTLDLQGHWRVWRGNGPQSVFDVAPPVVTGAHLTGGSGGTVFVFGDTARVVVEATDEKRLAWVGYQYLITAPWGGVAYGRDSTPVSGRSAAASMSFTLPTGIPGPMATLAFVRDSVGQESILQLTPATVGYPEREPPAVTGSLSGPRGSGLFVPGDTMALDISGTDDSRLAWLGYRVGDPVLAQDSVAVTDLSARVFLSIQVPPLWLGAPQRMVLFARDTAGKIGTEIQPSLAIVQPVPHETRVVQLSNTLADIAYDPARNAVYANTGELVRINLATGAIDSTIILPPWTGYGPLSVDVTTGGDSLLTVTGRLGPLGFSGGYLVSVRLSTGQIDTALVLDVPTVGYGERPYRARVVSNGKVLFTAGPVGSTTELYEYDLVSRAVRRRPEVTLPLVATMDRMLDRSRLVTLNDCCPLTGQVYVAATDAFSGPRPLGGGVDGTSISSDVGGTTWLVGSQLLTADLTPIRVLSPPGRAPGTASALSPDGGTAYFAAEKGVLKVRVADGALLEYTTLPIPQGYAGLPNFIKVLPNGTTLLVGLYAFVFLVDIS